MKIKDARGQNMKVISKKNKDLIKEYFKQNPDSSKAECQRTLGIAYTTLQRHLKDLGWA